ncbi:SMP-30/gluconolactonase/LRE family protein [Sphingobacterium sp. SYP-B4668]|uniref:SMP-30/gluconolactonase/LRE family protein n=1 Tax=Sphingobacterium sp. SYP-B4668 TaxID=2996035 RepID=UPI0022DE16DE|nr:SMP-30/gluconolactonase/LRE family protein [Sphingobacterium sp. SYP-B4668]
MTAYTNRKLAVLVLMLLLSPLVIFGQTSPKIFEGATIQVMHPDFKKIIAPTAKVELLADGMQWTEGPVWVKQGNYLLFSDPRLNTVYKWSLNNGLEKFLTPAGYQGTDFYSEEPGTNGLLINKDGHLVACDHGNRRIVEIDLATKEMNPLSTHWQQQRFNSPNDICQHQRGDYFFTDPPYGLPNRERDTINREIQANGVYRLDRSGKTTQLISNLTRPNGIALSSRQDKLYVAISDGKNPYIMEYPLKDNLEVGEGRIFVDFKSKFPTEHVAADGIKVHSDGYVFAAAGNGIIVMNSKGELLGRIKLGTATANCNFGGDGHLYITASDKLLRVPLLNL